MSRRTRQCHGGIHTPQMAFYHAVHSYKGGLPVIAAMMGITPSLDTLRKKLDPDQNSHHLRLDQAMDILRITKDPRILDAICAEVEAVWFMPDTVPPAPADMDVLYSSTSLMKRSVQLISELECALRDGDINEDERARLDKHIMRLFQATHYVSETASRFERGSEEQS
ncbi:phage regulatory CII family protein [Nitrincola iocasae]|uniref:Uncharacterized protein n=1 Tax=Nitrincola iocasae TaxID=2614693 RepID=A0A5J6LD89_9GAMM|nr:phage regulatory CII family protein [Nitrincola iocasae]QEW06336.1 hypothetical protein F5I99_07365 [Nitrincola iocasae]